MSDSFESLRREINIAGDLQSVVRTMKVLAASSIEQYERSVRALGDYSRVIELSLAVCLRDTSEAALTVDQGRKDRPGTTFAVVFGSDQGLVGQFNELVADFAVKALADQRNRVEVWAVGERLHDMLDGADLMQTIRFSVPNSVEGITPLIGQILAESEVRHSRGELTELHLFYNRPTSGPVFSPVGRRLLPLDESWRSDLIGRSWPTGNLPQVIGDGIDTLRALIREYLFISLFQACAESLASENASRLAAMRRADKNINERLEELSRTFYRLRQSDIDAELFDVISGFESLKMGKRSDRREVEDHQT